ncbi:hypothetical protein [Crocinitomix algicola]|uniref:hypothetical protein n=1 Tax=Crocinitomix algicola TaxID=1740263 RepID=UPI0008316FB6|nr:hypothetical protein [Crocinitomix algicola]
MIKKLFWRKSKYQNFWLWFHDFDEILYEAFKEDPEHNAMRRLLVMRLFNIHRSIGFEIVKNNPEFPFEIVVTANGSKEAIDHIKHLAIHQTETKNFNFTWLKQRSSKKNVRVHYRGLDLSYENISFEPIPNNEKFGVCLYIDGFKQNEAYIGATYLLLDHLLGEYDVTHHLNYLDWQVREQGCTKGRPFYELRAVIDKVKSKLKHE